MLARHVPCDSPHSMAMGHGKGRLGDMRNKVGSVVLRLGGQFLLDTQISRMCWHRYQCPSRTQTKRFLSTWVGPALADGHWSVQTRELPGYWGCLANKPCKQQPCGSLPSVVVPCPPSPHSWLQPLRLPLGKAVPCGRGEGRCQRISCSLWSCVPHKKPHRIYRKRQRSADFSYWACVGGWNIATPV